MKFLIVCKGIKYKILYKIIDYIMSLVELLKNISIAVGDKQWQLLMFLRETIRNYGYRELKTLRNHSEMVWKVLLDVASEGYQEIIFDIFENLERLNIEKPIGWHELLMGRYMPYTLEGTEFFLKLILKEIVKFGYLSEEYSRLNHIEFILRSRIESEDFLGGYGIFCN